MKAILEIEMPNDCNNCPLNVKMLYEGSECTYNLCVPLDAEIEYGILGPLKNCPLKPVE
jgi:hypothetical protein